MYEMRNVANLIDLFGDLETLARYTITFDLNDREIVYIEDCGVGPHYGEYRLISVGTFYDPDGDGCYEPAPDMHFEVDPSDDHNHGWRSGSWLPVAHDHRFQGERLSSWAYDVEKSTGEVIWRRGFKSVWLPKNRAFARQWDHQFGEDRIMVPAQKAAAKFRAEQELERAKADRKRRRTRKSA